MSLAYTKRPGAMAFGPSGHPSELLAQARDDIGLAEWVLAAWSVASGPTVSDLLQDLEGVLAELSLPRRRAIVRAAEAVTEAGWLAARPVTIDGEDRSRSTLIALRNRGPLPVSSGVNACARELSAADLTAPRRPK